MNQPYGGMGQPGVQRIVVEQRSSWVRRLLFIGLIVMLFFSLMFNAGLLALLAVSQAMAAVHVDDGPALEGGRLLERWHSGSKRADAKVAIIRAQGVLMGDVADDVLAQIDRAKRDDRVRAVVLAVDSPGGTVSSSEHLYYRLKELREGVDGHAGKPIVVSMGSMATSGGYYIAAAAGPGAKMIAERATITGSIGVIMPRYDVSQLLEGWKVTVQSITSGPMKDAGSPFRPFGDEERQYWQGIVDQSYKRFQEVVAEARPQIPGVELQRLADGRVFTATDALGHKLIDQIGYLEEAIEEAKRVAGVSDARVVTYQRPPTLADTLFGAWAPQAQGLDAQRVLEMTTPRAYYLVGGALPLTYGRQ